MDSRKKVKIRFEMFAKTILNKQGDESYLFSQQAMIDFLDSFNNLAIHDVSNQRELLIDFCLKAEEVAKEYRYLVPSDEFIDEYLKDN